MRGSSKKAPADEIKRQTPCSTGVGKGVPILAINEFFKSIYHMNKKVVVTGVLAVIVVAGGVSLFMNNSGTPASGAPVVAAQTQQPANVVPVAPSSTVPLMQSTGSPFSQYKYFSKSHEVYPTLATGTVKAMGAFSYTKEDLGNNIYKFTLTNNAEGYSGQSVIVGAGQSVYFIEPSMGDDSATEDSITTDDSLVAVDAQGNILK